MGYLQPKVILFNTITPCCYTAGLKSAQISWFAHENAQIWNKWGKKIKFHVENGCQNSVWLHAGACTINVEQW